MQLNLARLLMMESVIHGRFVFYQEWCTKHVLGQDMCDRERLKFFWLINFKYRRWLDLQQCLWPLAIYLRPLKPRWVSSHCSSWLWSALWMTITSSSSKSWKTQSKHGKVVVIKIDVEGHECKALAKEVPSKSPIFDILTYNSLS